ncbi:C39 family peptidase [Mogibacterium timidum]|uniref:C39 family peptidase n=1 Tax=Mogibacterium timidum TaxID=35519 RepID=UPI00248B1089|nr:C39 family peptidase [Mogibacterium timidum]
MGSMWFNQFDPRWSRKAYAGRTMAASGCGPTAIANIVSSKHDSVTPADVADWLTSHGYASNGNGTYWSGIKAALDAYGCPATQHSSMQPFFNEMAKGNRWGIILFRAGTRGGITWTGGGHFVAIVKGYEYRNGKHYLYVSDSGSRGHDGWYTYEDHMRGLIPALWSCVVNGISSTVTPTPNPNPPAPSGSSMSALYQVKSTIGLNVRGGAGTSYAKIGGLANGTKVTITQISGNWGYAPNAGGWVCMDYLVKVGASAGASTNVVAGGTYTLTMDMRVRTGPGTGFRNKKRSELTTDGKKHARAGIYAILAAGTRVTVLEVRGNWARIPSGWVCIWQGNTRYMR